MNPAPGTENSPAGGLGLVDLSRLALLTLGADGLLVTDDAGRAVITEGRPAEGRPAEGRPAHRTPLITDADRRIGTLSLIYAEDAGPAPDTLIRAFARHLGTALDRHLASGPDGRNQGVVFGVGDPERLPEAINEITAQVTEVVRPLTGATAVGIMVWDPDRGILTALPGAFGATDALLAASVTGPTTNMLSASVRVLATGQPYLSNQASGDPGILQSYVELFDIHRILSVPLDRGNRRIGVLHLINKPEEFTAADITAVETVSPQIAIAVQLARSVARMAARQQLEGIIAAAAVAIASGKPSTESLLPAFDHLGAVTGASLVTLVPREGPPVIRRTGAADAALEARLLADARTLDSAATGAFPHRAGDPGWAALHAPVDLSGERAATLSVLRRTGEPFTSEEENVVARLARLVALAWTSERYQHQLAELARLRERERIADGLHDRVAQILFAAQLGLDSLLDEASDGTSRERLVEIRDLLTGGDTAIREVIHRLAAAPRADLARRLRLAVESVEEEFDVAVHVQIAADGALHTVAGPVADAAVKLAREGTVNAAKHAGPCRISLEASLDDGGELVVAVIDDGLGLGAGPARHGLGSLRRTVADAGGALSVTPSSDGFGTRVLATFPP